MKKRVKKSHEVLEKLVGENQVIYGVSIGFGALSNVKISPLEIRQSQSNRIRSHSSGVGEPLSREVVRALILLRVKRALRSWVHNQIK